MTCDRFSGWMTTRRRIGRFGCDRVALAVQQEQRGRALRQAIRQGRVGDDERDRGVLAACSPAARAGTPDPAARTRRPPSARPAWRRPAPACAAGRCPRAPPAPRRARRSAFASRFARALQLRVRQSLALPHERDGVRRPRRLRVEQVVDARAGGVPRVGARSTPPPPCAARPRRAASSRVHAPPRRPPPSPPAPAAGSPAQRSTVARSKSAVAYSSTPAIRPPSSQSASVRSNFALTCAEASPESSGPTARPGSSSLSSGAFCHANSTWNRGVCARLRAGRTRSTTCSKGMSWCCCAPSDRSFTRPSSSADGGRARQLHAQRQRVDEEADQALDLGVRRGWRSACRPPRRPGRRAGRARPPIRPAAS